MKELLLTALLLTFAAGTAIAQQPGDSGSHGGGKGKPGSAHTRGHFGNPVERLTDLLTLDETQAAAIELIFEDSRLLREQEHERSRALAEENRAITHAQIMDVLTTEQQALFEEHWQEREARKAERGFEGRRGARESEG
jgi:Spy/CpxP family protein refolding chaperone